MNSEISSPSVPVPEWPALPVRRRETLEIFDTALKLYRRYFWVLLGWSALVSCTALVPVLNWFSFLALPLLYGAVSCCVAAAVRGQRVKFSQCWAFSKPRYGPLLGTTLLSYVVLFGVYVVICIVALLVGLLGVWALASAPRPLQITGIVIGTLLGMIAFSVLIMVAFGWTSMVPIVVCLEDDKRNTAALGRAFDLLKGNWMRVFGLSLILGLALMAVFTIVGVVYMLIGAGAASSIFSSRPSESAIIGLMGTFAAFMGFFALIWNPAQSLIIAVLYLDLRVRREALDLEWTAYASAPPVAPSAAPVDFVTPSLVTRDEAFSPAATPASFAAGAMELSSEIAPQITNPGIFVTPEAPKVDIPVSSFSAAPASNSVLPVSEAPFDLTADANSSRIAPDNSVASSFAPVPNEIAPDAAQKNAASQVSLDKIEVDAAPIDEARRD